MSRLLRRLTVLSAAILLVADGTAHGQVVETFTVAVPQGGVGGSVYAPPGSSVPPRDAQQPPATGNARIRGRVLAADTGKPLRRATVRLSGVGAREGRSMSTDQNGTYEFTQLPAGQYTLTASKSSYVTMGYKQPRPNTTPRPVTVNDREALDRIDIALPPGGVITGRIIDEFGDPVSDVMVSAQRQQYMNGVRRPVGTGPANSSNDIGEFRLFGLAPGDYYVSATPRPGFMGNPFEVNADRTGYAATYYPSAPDVASAQRITVHAGEQISNIVVAMALTRVARVSGVAMDGSGRPSRGGMVMAIGTETFGPAAGTTALRPDGTFSFNGLPPGEYTLRTMGNGPGGPGGPNQMPAVSVARVIVNGADVSNVILQPQSQVRVSGRLTGDPALLAQIKPQAARVTFAPMGPTFSGPVGMQPNLHDDLTFEAMVFPGDYLVRPLGLNPGVIKAVRTGGRDVTRSLAVQPDSSLSDLEIELAAATAKIVVSASNARSEAVADRDIIIFTQDESEWGVQMPGHSSFGHTDEQGAYQSVPLLSGSYYVVDADGLGPGDSADPDVLADLRSRAQRVRVGEGETANISIKISGR